MFHFSLYKRIIGILMGILIGADSCGHEAVATAAARLLEGSPCSTYPCQALRTSSLQQIACCREL